MQRHNRAMESRSQHTNVEKEWQQRKEKQNVEKALKMPEDASNNVQLEQFAKRMHIPFSRDVFMRDALPIDGARRNESSIVNLDDTSGPGTHWVAYAKRENRVVYFEQFCFWNLQPSKELIVWTRRDENWVQSVDQSSAQNGFRMLH